MSKRYTFILTSDDGGSPAQMDLEKTKTPGNPSTPTFGDFHVYKDGVHDTSIYVYSNSDGSYYFEYTETASYTVYIGSGGAGHAAQAELTDIFLYGDDALTETDIDDVTIGVSGGSLYVKDDGIDTDQLADDAVDKDKLAADVAGDGLSQAAGGELDVNVDDSTIEISTDTLQVKDDGIDKTKLAADVAGDGLSQAAGGELDVNVDDSTIEISTDTLQVKDDGIDKTKLAADVAGDGLEQNVDGSLSPAVDDVTLEVDANDGKLKVKTAAISSHIRPNTIYTVPMEAGTSDGDTPSLNPTWQTTNSSYEKKLAVKFVKQSGDNFINLHCLTSLVGGSDGYGRVKLEATSTTLGTTNHEGTSGIQVTGVTQDLFIALGDVPDFEEVTINVYIKKTSGAEAFGLKKDCILYTTPVQVTT